MSKLAFVAFSDPHLGRTWGAHTVPMTRAALSDAYFDPINEIIKNYPDTPLVCGGDWYDKAHNDEALIEKTMPLLRKMAVVVAGNHDHVNRAEATTTLSLQNNLMEHESTITIASDHMNAVQASVSDLNGVTVYAVPHHGTQMLFEQALMEVQAFAVEDEQPKVLVIHCNFGAPGEGKPDSNLYLTPALRATLEKTFDYILVGHEHLPKRVGNTFVMGSTQPCNFGELGPRFCYEFHLDDNGELTVEQVKLRSTLTHVTYDVNDLLKSDERSGAKLVDLKGILPIAQARNVQRAVKEFFDGGALAVRMDVTFDSGTTIEGDAVAGSMSNLLDVVRHEISDNKDWTALLEKMLAELNEEQQA